MSKLAQIYSDLGRFRGSMYLAHRAMQIIHPALSLRGYYLVAQPVPNAPLLPAHRGQNITIRNIRREDPVLDQLGRSTEEFSRRFDSGAIGFAAFKSEKLVGFAWITEGDYREFEDRCIIRPAPRGAAVWDFDFYVAETERTGLVFARLWDEIFKHLRTKKIQWSLSRISQYNNKLINSQIRTGAKIIGRYWFFGLGCLQFMYSSISPRIHLSWRPQTVPTITVTAPYG